MILVPEAEGTLRRHSWWPGSHVNEVLRGLFAGRCGTSVPAVPETFGEDIVSWLESGTCVWRETDMMNTIRGGEEERGRLKG